jgi:hypothetical protein
MTHEVMDAFKKAERKIIRTVDRTIARASKHGRKIVLVYQMGKVGSRSIFYALQSSREFEVFHLHRMLPSANCRQILHSLNCANLESAINERTWLELFEKLILAEREVYVISGTREPIARNMSAYFQNYDLAALRENNMEAVASKFIDTYSHDTPLRWFSEQFHKVLGIDVYAEPFNREAGFGTYTRRNTRALVLTAEADNAAKHAIISEFLESNSVGALDNRNVGSRKDYRNEYSEFKESIRFPEALVEWLFSSAYMENFYTEKAISALRSKYEYN